MAQTHPTEDAAHQVMEPAEDTGEYTEATELLHADAGDISAGRVALEQSTAKSISADHVTLRQSAVRNITAETATMTQSAAFRLKSGDLAVHESPLGIVSSDRVDIFDSVIGVVNGPINVGEGSARVLVQIGPADPAVKPVLNAQAALSLGAGFGATIVLLSRLLRRLLGN
jgi:hypothetical protein